MIKHLPLILFFTSCAQFTVQDYKTVYQATFLKVDNDIPITQEYIDSRNYSFAKVRIGDDAPAVLVLVSIKDNLYTWISAGSEKIVTKNGKIIETFGLQHNVKVLDSRDLSLSISKHDVLVRLDNPLAVVQQNLTVSDAVNNSHSVQLYIEQFYSSPLRWSGKNYYWVDTKTNLTKRTHQHIHPYQDSIEIEFFYK